MTEAVADSLSARACRPEDIQSVLELWRQADATPGLTDTAADLSRPGHSLLLTAEDPIAEHL